jgi:hypothetical protein
MLQISGNAETAFAGLNSIRLAPKVYIEWNYNSVQRPYVVSTSSAGPMTAANSLGTASLWTVTNGGSVVSASGLDFVSDIDSTASGLLLHTNSTRATFNSPVITVTPANKSYYKIVFYVKADQATRYNNLATIPATAISASTSSPGTTNTYYYRIVPVDHNGRRSANDLNGSDIFSFATAANPTKLILNWDTVKYRSAAYNIYRGTDSSFMPYVTTMPLRTLSVQNVNISGTSGSFTVNNSAHINLSETFVFNSSRSAGRSVLYDQSTWVITAISGNLITASLTYNPGISNNSTSDAGSRARYSSNPTIIMQSYVDNPSIAPSLLDAIPIHSTKVRIMPTVYLSKGANVLETTKTFVRVFETDNSEPQVTRSMVEVDGVNYRRVEVWFGSNEQFDSVRLDIDVDASYVSPQVVIYRPEMHQMNEWTFYTLQNYPIESVFSSHRPGETLLNPFLNASDKKINSNYISSTITTDRPVSFVCYNPDRFYGNILPFKQMYDTTMNNTMRYYISDQLNSTSTVAPTSIRAQYNNYMSINKIVIKGSNVFSNFNAASGVVTLLGSFGSSSIAFNLGDWDKNGLLDLYYNGISWTTVRPTDGTYPPTLTDSGALQNVIQQVSGIILNINYLQSQSSDIVGDSHILRAHVIEISPRLEIDVSNLTQDITVDKTLDSADLAAGFPLGYANSNTGDIVISNVPVYKNTFPHSIFETFSDDSTFSNLLRQNIKFTMALYSPAADFSGYIPLTTMFSDNWSISGLNNITVNLFDPAQTQLMGVQPPDYYGHHENMFYTITNILDASGFSDYDYDGLKKIMSGKATSTSHFWTDRKTQSAMDAVKAFFVAHQIGAYFDEYGMMRFKDLDKIINDFFDDSFYPDFAVTDVNVSITKGTGSGAYQIGYIPNIFKDSYNSSTNKKIGKISIQYQAPFKQFTAQNNSNLMGQQDVQPFGVWHATTGGVIKSWTDRSITSNQDYFHVQPSLTIMGGTRVPRYTLGDFEGTAFLQGELISWKGLSYKFTPYQSKASQPLAPYYSQGFAAKISDGQELVEYVNEFANQDDRINQIVFDFTGVVNGVTRGNRFTSIRNHYLYDDAIGGIPTGYVSPSSAFFKRLVTSSSSISTIGSHTSNIVFDKNVAVFTLKKQKTTKTNPVVLIPQKSTNYGDYMVPTAASSFNYYSFTFNSHNFADPKINWNNHEHTKLEVGIYINTDYGKFMFSLQNDKNKTFLKPAYDAALGDTYTPYTFKEYASAAWQPIAHKLVKNIYDGHEHRFSILFHKDKDHANPSQTDSNNKMRYQYFTIFIDSHKYGPFLINSRGSKQGVNPTDSFGFYAKNLTKSTGKANVEHPLKVHLTEMYAVKWPDNWGKQIDGNRIKWHWEHPYFLNKIVNQEPDAEPPYYFWGRNWLTGVNFYDSADFETTPVYPESLELVYTGYGAGDNSKTELTKTDNKSISHSDLHATPFRARFAVVNTDTQVVVLADANQQVDGNKFTPMALQGNYSKFSDKILIEKIIDPTSIANAISIDTQWIQSQNDAEKLMNKLEFLTNSFSADVNVTIFGNPLIQIGDYCQMIYSAKKIGYNPENTSNSVINKIFLVESVNQKYSTGLETSLTLKPMFQLPQ